MKLRIFCAKCKREVDSFRWWDDFENDKRILVARCHGENDRMELEPGELIELSRYEPVNGVAFVQTPKALTDERESP